MTRRATAVKGYFVAPYQIPHAMKNILLLAALLAACPAFAQKKGKVDPKDVKIDSLSQVNAGLASRLDSASKELARYRAMHASLRDKVIKYDFAPERTDALIDSLKTAREKTFSSLSNDAKALNDSVAVLAGQNAELKGRMEKIEADKKNNEVVMEELRKLKSLLDEGILTQAEFDARKAKVMKDW